MANEAWGSLSSDDESDQKRISLSEPPTSSLVNSLFHARRKPSQVAPSKIKGPPNRFASEKVTVPNSALGVSPEPAAASDVVDSEVQEKIKALDDEIKTFKAENEKLAKLRAEQQAASDRLKRDIESFQAEKEQQRQAIEAFKAEETKKILKEKKQLNSKTRETQSDRRSVRNETDALKQQLQAQEEGSQKEIAKWKGAAERYKARTDALARRNAELEQQVKVLDKERLDLLEKLDKALKRTAPPKPKPAGVVDGHVVSPPSSGDKQPSLSGVLRKSSAPSLPKHISGQVARSPRARDIVAPTANALMPPMADYSFDEDDGDDDDDDDESETAAAAAALVAGNTDADVDSPADFATAPSPAAAAPLQEPLSIRGPSPSSARRSVVPSAAIVDDDRSGHVAGIADTRRRGRTSSAAVGDVSSGFGAQSSQASSRRTPPSHNDGVRTVTYSNGTRKQTFPDGRSVVYYPNGDTKQTYPDNYVIYHYAAEDPLCYCCKLPDGSEVLYFKNGETQKFYPDGTIVGGSEDDDSCNWTADGYD